MVPFLSNTRPESIDSGTLSDEPDYISNLPSSESKLQKKRKQNCVASTKSRRKKQEKIQTLRDQIQDRASEKKRLEAEIEEKKKKFEETEILRKKIEDILRFQKIPFDLDN